ncbi:MAG: DUF6434 domain-containing protein, partial [Pseudomonadota bacterium]
MSQRVRPPFSAEMTADQFLGWYWEKAQLEVICAALDLPKTGSKAGLRQRIADHLAGEIPTPAPKTKAHQTAGFSWSKARLTGDEIINDQISFGPNVRGFFRAAIGPNFVCSGEFMAWVKAHQGHSLNDAVTAW